MCGLSCRLSGLAFLCLAAAFRLIAAPPVLSEPATPADLVLVEGSSGFIRVLGSAGTNGTVQWFRDGAPMVPGPTGNTLSFTNAIPGDEGGYHVVLSNSEGSVTSRTARVVIPPALTIQRVANVPIGGSALALALDGDRLFVGLGDGPSQVAGLEIYDVSVPAAPVFLGSYRLPRVGTGLRVRDVVVDGATAYLAAGTQGLRILDVSDAASPRELGAFTNQQAFADLDVVGNRVYAARTSGMSILDVSDPSAITVLGQFQMQSATGIAVQGNLAVLVNALASADILDVTDASRPVRIGTLFTGDPMNTLRWRGHQLVVSGGIVPHVFDLSRPKHPLKLGGYVAPVDSVGMALLDDLVLDGGVPALGRPQHFNVFDIGSLPHVFPVGRLQMGGAVEDIVVHRGHIFAAATRAGVDVLTMEPNGPPVVVRPLGPLRVAAGSNVELQARISGGLLSHQWFKEGESIPGATNRVLRLPNVSQEQMGNYSVVASNRLGAISGGIATLTLADEMAIRIVHGTGTTGAAARPNLFGPPGFQGYLLASTNLVDWQPIWFGELGLTPPGVSDPISPLPAARYYRLEPGVE